MRKAVERRDTKRSYTYKTLKDCQIGDNANLYAVVMDATFPHKSFKSNKYLASLKLADPSCR